MHVKLILGVSLHYTMCSQRIVVNVVNVVKTNIFDLPMQEMSRLARVILVF